MIAAMIEKARAAQAVLNGFSQRQVDAVAREIAKTVFDNAAYFARLAVDETRMGVYEDKVQKNQGKSRIIWNSLKGVKSVGVISRDEAAGITEIARPVGVVGAVTPCTNPIVTPMCNAMFAVKGRNAIIIAPHPRAKRCNKILLDTINERIAALGAPVNTIQYIEEPSVQLSAELMQAVDVVVATGGMGMVKSAYASGKPAYGVGAGNVQCIIDRGVNLDEAVPKIIAGRTFDNGIICSGEQTVIAPREDYDRVIGAFTQRGCVFVSDPSQKEALRRALFPNGVMNKALVGQNAAAVAAAAGLDAPENVQAILVEADGCGEADLFSKEKMCPVLSTYRFGEFSEAVAIAQANLDVEGRGHSVSLHTPDHSHALYAGERLTVCRVLVNQICSTMNGGAFGNSLTPTTTLGCGSWGNNSISENFSHRHLLNIIRVAEQKPGAVQPPDEEIWG